MESLLFTYLKDKASDQMTMNNTAYINSDHKTYTYNELFNLVLEKIATYKNKTLSKTPYLIVMNDVRSIASIIALLSLGYSPILINGKNLSPVEKKKNEQQSFLTVHNVINDYPDYSFDIRKLNEETNKINNTITINTPSYGRIGIFSSGSMGDPKTIYLDEKTMIDKISESKYNNRYRKIYNTAPLSSVSGLFTNLFMPIAGKYSDAILTNNEFDMLDARRATDVFLPRNFLDIVTPYQIEAEINIEKIFFYGEQNSKAIIKTIRESIQLPDNTFVNVYGSTECGGLVCECEEKDFKTLYVYYFNIEKDTIIYSYDSSNLYIKIGDYVRKLDKNTAEKYLALERTKYIPCGFVNDKITLDKNKCIGEGIVNGTIHTEDIMTFIDGKIYVIGRKKDVEKNYRLANFDGEISALLKKTCATFLDEYNNLCLAIRYDLFDKDDKRHPKITYFRELIKEYKSIIKKINFKYPMINEIFFFPNDKFILSGGIKKSRRNQFQSLIEEGRKTNYYLDNFDIVLKKHIEEVCHNKLGYIPRFTINEGKSIIFNKDDIKLEQLVELLNDLGIILILYDKDSNYYVTYDDRYFLNSNTKKVYSEETIESLRDYAKHNLLIERLLTINKDYYVDDGVFNCLSIPHHWTESVIYCKKGVTKNNEVILVPYFCFHKNYNDIYLLEKESFYRSQIKESKKEVEARLYKTYPGISFEDYKIPTQLPEDGVDELSIFGDEIIIDTNNKIKIHRIKGNGERKKINSVYCDIIGKSYLYYNRANIIIKNLVLRRIKNEPKH